MHIAHILHACGCAKFRTSAHPHACKMCAMCIVWLPEFCFAKKFLEMCVKVRMCEISHVRTFTHISKNFFAKQTPGSHTMHVAHILQACGCADVRNFARPHACKMCATCMVWLPEFFFAKKFLEMCVKVRMCEISHVRTPARVQNVCNVHCVAARDFFCKKNFGYVCEIVDVR